MKWVNVIGLILQFAAFWFAAPELLGAKTLKRFEIGLTRLLSSIPLIILMIGCVGYGLSFAIAGVLKGMKGAEEGLSESEFYSFIITLGIGTLVYIVFMFFFNRIKAWLEKRIAEPLISGLISNNHIRSTALIIGAVLFTVGFILQLGVVLLT